MSKKKLFIFFIILMIFGADKIPDIAKGMAQGIRKVKNATQEIRSEIKKSAEKKGIDTDSISKEIDKVKDDIDDLTFLSKTKRTKNKIIKKYTQTFELKNGFINDLSVLDLIFNCGPNSKEYM